MNHPYRMIAIDIDGTLLCPRGTVRPRTRAAIHKAVGAGIAICFATGRSWRESRAIIKDVGHHSSAVFATGALIVDTQANLTLQRRLMDGELARQVSAFFESHGQSVLALQDADAAGVDYLVTEDTPLHAETRQWLTMTQTAVHRRGDLGTATHQHTVRVSIVAGAKDVEKCQQGLIAQFGPRVVSQSLVVPSNGIRVLEVFGPAVNKWQGVLDVAALHDVAAHQIAAVGDDVNDLSMITQAALGVAMGNAPPHVRSAAHRTIGHNHADGLAEFLEELVQQS